jgi:hypothetical protein
MDIKSIKRSFLAAFPVVGPHANIEAELMLAGKKPITWAFVASDEVILRGLGAQKKQQGRKLLDRAVADGKLIAVDVECPYPEHPEYVAIFRHYAQLGQEENLARVSECNRRAFNRLGLSEVPLGKDMGYYLGYRKRDILFFNYVVNSNLLPMFIKRGIIGLHSPCQRARREELLLEAGYDLQAWRDSFPRPRHD